MQVSLLDVLLPVGISFYMFQAIGYMVDVYHRDIDAEKNFLVYALFISFFPQLAAGPIERAKNLLPQFHKEYTFNYDKAAEGIIQMGWGFFQKVVIADRVAVVVNNVLTPIVHFRESLGRLQQYVLRFKYIVILEVIAILQ